MTKKRILPKEEIEKENKKKQTSKKPAWRQGDIIDQQEEILHDLKKALTDNRRHHKTVTDKLASHEKIMMKTLVAINKKLDAYEKRAKDLLTKAEDIEETLCNVLLAIRQNEYLQAWYPAQHGYPEMKVVGKHPVKVNGPKTETP